MALSQLDIGLLFVAAWLIYKIATSRGILPAQTTPLRGPPRASLAFGVSKQLRDAPDATVLYEQWQKDYGLAFSTPTTFGGTKIVLNDPKAVAHFFAREGFGYLRPEISKRFIEVAFGRNLLWAEGDIHKRQRKSLTPAFTNTSIRNYTAAFYDSAYKCTNKWNALLESSANGNSIIEVQQWMNRISLDTIGIAGFSHDFHTLDGQPSVFESIDWTKGAFAFGIVLLLAAGFPIVMKLPSGKMTEMAKMKSELSGIADQLLAKGKEEGTEDKSIIGLLIKAESEDASFRMTKDEIVAQMNLLLLAGYETTSVSLTWALIELSRKPEVQKRLRDELSQLGASDPTYEQLISSLPYLEAVVMETLRLHPPVAEAVRVAGEDDVVPLSVPVTDRSGKTIDSVFIAKGSTVSVPLRTVNTSETFWGPTAKEFNPDRWLAEENLARAKDIQGHRHILTFIDGPRTCLGKGFALAEFKAVLSVLVKTYAFELPEGPETEFKKVPALLPRPSLVGGARYSVPLRVRYA